MNNVIKIQLVDTSMLIAGQYAKIKDSETFCMVEDNRFNILTPDMNFKRFFNISEYFISDCI